jgi:hypothetical protein
MKITNTNIRKSKIKHSTVNNFVYFLEIKKDIFTISVSCPKNISLVKVRKKEKSNIKIMMLLFSFGSGNES